MPVRRIRSKPSDGKLRNALCLTAPLPVRPHCSGWFRSVVSSTVAPFRVCVSARSHAARSGVLTGTERQFSSTGTVAGQSIESGDRSSRWLPDGAGKDESGAGPVPARRARRPVRCFRGFRNRQERHRLPYGGSLRRTSQSSAIVQLEKGMTCCSWRPALHLPFESQPLQGIPPLRIMGTGPDCQCHLASSTDDSEPMQPPPARVDRYGSLRRCSVVVYAAYSDLRRKRMSAGATVHAMGLQADTATSEFVLMAPPVRRSVEEGPVPDVLDHIRRFSAFGTRTASESIDGIPYLINAFWTAGQRRSHSLHEVSYRACFKAELPEFFISRLTRPGDTVLDPFMGRGTSPLQAVLMGRKALGNDINPLSVMLVRPPPARDESRGGGTGAARDRLGSWSIRVRTPRQRRLRAHRLLPSPHSQAIAFAAKLDRRAREIPRR